jgi:16S rRNA (guanine966-N2)-methyltransferase
MTRIISGVAGSLKLASPAKSTRPTSDRVRESIFSRIDARGIIEGASALDLYAGTGALGLEALSRGATSAILVESNRQAAAVCEVNCKKVDKNLFAEGVDVRIKVVIQPVNTFLTAGEPTPTFDLVFIDPPYDITNEEVVENLQNLMGWLKPDATVVLERSSRTELPTLPTGLVLDETKSYGDTAVHWLNLG